MCSLKKLDCTRKLWGFLLADDQNQADSPRFCGLAVKNPQKPIVFYGVLFGSAKYMCGMQANNRLVYPMSLLKTSSATQLLLRPKPGQPWTQGRKFWAVAETCSHYPSQDAVKGCALTDSRSNLNSTEMLPSGRASRAGNAHAATCKPAVVGTLATASVAFYFSST